jgi:hypothetical protein
MFCCFLVYRRCLSSKRGRRLYSVGAPLPKDRTIRFGIVDPLFAFVRLHPLIAEAPIAPFFRKRSSINLGGEEGSQLPFIGIS